MKKLIAFLILALMAVPVFAVSFANTPSNTRGVKSLTLPSTTTTGCVTLDGGAFLSYDLTAVGGNIRWLPTDTATATAYQTIFNGATNSEGSDPILYPAGTTWYFLPETAGITLEVVYWNF